MRLGLMILGVACLLPGATMASDDEAIHEARWAEVDLSRGLPEDLVDPEGKTRWDLRSLTISGTFSRTVLVAEGVADRGARVEQRVAAPGLSPVSRLIVDPTGGDGAERWLRPDRDPDLLKTSDLRPIQFEERRADGVDRVWVRAQRVGIGWVLLPSGPREVVLQRALLMRRADGQSRFVPDSLIHRWVDPRAGVVAEVRGPATDDGTGREEIEEVAVVEQVLRGQTPMRIYIDQHARPPGSVVRYGLDRASVEGGSVEVSQLTPDAFVTIGDLAQASAWDFSANNSTNFPGMEQIASSISPVLAETTENFGECGITTAGRRMSREDRNFLDPANANITLSITEEQGGVDSAGTIFLRAAVKNEGVGGVGFGAESRTCHDGAGRSEVPLWRFENEDADGDWYMQVGDKWGNGRCSTSGTFCRNDGECPMGETCDGRFDCQQTIFANAIITNTLYSNACTGTSIGDLNGVQTGEVIAEGPVTLPSGHIFNSLLVRQVIEYCTYLGSSCGSSFQDVRTVLHLFEAPFLGTVARLMSALNSPSVDQFTTLPETDFKVGLFPPISITVTGTTASTVDLSWDPGSEPANIDGYRVYWDTDSGADSGYTYNSVNSPGDVTINGTTATVSGLTGGLQYFFTVTSLTDYCDPGRCRNDPAVTCDSANDPICPSPETIESLVYPTQLSGGPSLVPAEVSAVAGSGCVPTEEVPTLTVDKLGTDLEICWDLVADTCVDGYRILGADSPESGTNFSAVVPDTGLTDCFNFDPTETYFLVVGKGPGGAGPTGHF